MTIAKETSEENCPICYTEITNIDVSITICKHKLHTSCLLRCSNTCPICRTNLLLNNPTGKKHTGIYNSDQHREEINIQNISVDDLDQSARNLLEENKEFEKLTKEIKRNEEKRQQYIERLERVDNAKYRLFFTK